jgi:hypothetical protein
MENMMSDQKFTTGNRVRNAARPEWGVGTVQKAEAVPLNGTGTQRLTVRFPNAGSKVLLTAHARLVLVTELHDPLSDHDAPTMQGWDKLNGDWLAPMAQRKVDEAMISLPAEVKDPFNSMKHRLGIMLGLYRFSRSGSGLMDWAVAQTGLDDPLSRFTRHELEAKYDRWCHERDNYLAKLLQEARSPGNDSQALQALIKAAPPSAQDTVRKITAWR